MPSTQFENAEALIAWMNEHAADLQNILASGHIPRPAAPEQATNAAATRTVVQEAQREVQQAPAPPSLPPPRPALLRTGDESSKNAIRLVNGLGTFLSPVNRYGDNVYYPDFRRIHTVISVCNDLIMNTKRFFDSSEFWHPILTHVYVAVLTVIQSLRAQRHSGTLSVANSVYLSHFEENHKLDLLPVPGPVVNALATLASCNPKVANYTSVSPDIGPSPSTSQAKFSVPGTAANAPTNMTARIAPIPALLDQYARLLTAVAAGNAQTAAQWPAFGNTIMGIAASAPGGNHPNASPANQDPIVAALNDVRKCFFLSPGCHEPIWCSTPVSTNLFNVHQRAAALFPPAVANANNNAMTWETFTMTTAHSGAWFRELTRIMTFYCKFFKDSTTLAEISPLGHTGNLVEFQFNGAAPVPIPTDRFGHIEMPFAARTRSAIVGEGDSLDAAAYAVNLSTWLANAPANQRRGPFFANEPVILESRNLVPTYGYGQVIADKYFVPTPRF